MHTANGAHMGEIASPRVSTPSIFICLFVLFVVAFIFEAGFLCVALTVLELIL